VSPTIIVAGLGRCGSSLVMQMLHAGGFTCVGDFPSFEVPDAQKPTPAFIASCAGKAVKVLDPQRVGLPGDVRVIWMQRDISQQAKSHAKFLGVMTGLHYDRAGRRKLEASLARDTLRAMDIIDGLPLLQMNFEDVLARPHVAAGMLGAFIQAPAFDARAAAGAVHARSPECAPGLDMELNLIGAAP
jgi:hypothetical protein